jgi:hypothetical protein
MIVSFPERTEDSEKYNTIEMLIKKLTNKKKATR